MNRLHDFLSFSEALSNLIEYYEIDEQAKSIISEIAKILVKENEG